MPELKEELLHSTSSTNVAGWLAAFPPISLEDMNEVSLMKRNDTKFVMKKADLPAVLSDLMDDYHLLEIEGNRLMSYQSVYFDTPDHFFYHAHHNGIAKRIKVRMRKYVESELHFLEIKQKDRLSRTVKKRIRIPGLNTDLTEVHQKFIDRTIGQTFRLIPAINSSFSRFSLVSKELAERVTIDLNLSYNGAAYNNDLVIVELKQARLKRSSPMFQVLKKHGIHPLSISKYCIGMASCNQALRSNRFKSKILKINKITA